jgi:hypothetical protein
MKRIAALAGFFGVFSALVACGGTPDGEGGTETTQQAEQAIGYGWQRPVTVENFSPAAAQVAGNAKTPLAGHSIGQVVTDPTVRVRKDGNACVTCHTWAAHMDRTAFCARIPQFLAEPTAKGDGTDPIQAKPQALKDLLSKWYEDGCPE